MKRKTFFAIMAIACCLLINACKKDKGIVPPKNDNNNGNNATPVGSPLGQPSVKTVGAAGGELVNADGRIKLIIPAGAVDAAKEFSIQPISNECPGAPGNAYRLLPHGQQFTQPVTIIFNYKPQDTAGSRPELLDVAFQDSNGEWQLVTNSSVNKLQKTITVTTTHFSDWNYFTSIRLTPSETGVEPNGTVDLKVTTRLPAHTPSSTVIHLLKEPRLLHSDEIREWDYHGEGIFMPQTAEGFYKAPDHVPSVNPEVVSVSINTHQKGQFFLVANISVVANNGIDYLQVDEDWTKYNDNCALYIYGTFGSDPGPNNRSVKINGTVVNADVWTPKFIRCKIDETIAGPIEIMANGHIIANSILHKYKGSILYERFHGGVLNSGSSNALKETTRFQFVYRGFGAPCPANVIPVINVDLTLASGTEANYTLGGFATVSTPPINGCVRTTSITLPTRSDYYFIEPPSLAGIPGFGADVEETNGGIRVKILYSVNDVSTGVVHRSSNCFGSSDDPPNGFGVGFDGFQGKWIDLEFIGATGLKLKGVTELQSAGLLASGILSGAWDGPSGHYEADGLMRSTLRDN